nr:type II toxin-antitoxin system VapC family toxin [Macrococcus canis]
MNVTNANSNFISTRSLVPQHLLSDFIYIDTNVLIDLYNQTAPHSPYSSLAIRYNEINRFINLIKSEDKMLLYSQHNIDEFYSKYTRTLQYQFKLQNNLENIKDIPTSQNVLINSQAKREISSFEKQVLGNFTEKITYSNRFVDTKQYEISEQTGLCLPDAKHIAIAEEQGIKSIFTNDDDFVSAQGINIYGGTPGIHNNSLNNTITHLY